MLLGRTMLQHWKGKIGICTHFPEGSPQGSGHRLHSAQPTSSRQSVYQVQSLRSTYRAMVPKPRPETAQPVYFPHITNFSGIIL
jgi:hypothetical protein